VRALIAIMMLVACDAGEKPAPPALPAAKKPVDQKKTSSIDLTYLPASSDVVVRLDVAALRATKLWPKHAPAIWKLLVPQLAGCERALHGVTSLTLGLPVDASPTGVHVIRGIDRDIALRCLRDSKSSGVTFDGDVITMRNVSGRLMTTTFVDAATLVMVDTNKPAAKPALTQILATGAPLADDAALVATHERIGRAPITLVSRRSGKLADAWATMGVKPVEVYGSMHVGDRLDIRFVMELATADEATQIANMLKGQLSSLKTFADRTNATAQGNTVTLDFGMTEVQVATMFASLQGLWGGSSVPQEQ
jgi:hypothetical protein